TPSRVPSDNGTFTLLASASGGFTGSVGVSATGIVTLNNANVGVHTITIVASDNCGATSNTSLQVFVENAPSVPGALIAQAVSTTSISLTWQPVGNTTEYVVYRIASVSSPFVAVGTTSVPSFVDSNVTPNTAYLYRVRAFGPGGLSSFYSSMDLATT